MNTSQDILKQVAALLLQSFNNSSQQTGVNSVADHHAPNLKSQFSNGRYGMPNSTDLSTLVGRHVLFIGDAENLSYTYRNEELDLDFGSLLSSVRALANQVEAYAFATVTEGQPMEYAEQYFKSCGWTPMLNPARHEHGKVIANSDAAILINTGRLLSQSKANTLLIGSGDGELGNAIAEFAQGLPNRPRIITIGRSGSLSNKLVAGRNLHIAANISLGSDHVKPIHHH